MTACKTEKEKAEKLLINRSYDEVCAELTKNGVEKIDTALINFTQPYTAKAPTAEQKKTMRRAKIMLMGDSFTEGGGASEIGSFFYSSLTDLGGYFELVGINEYRTETLDKHYRNHCSAGGWTAKKLHDAYNEKVKGNIDYDIGIIHIGLNDGYQNLSVEDYLKHYDSFIADVFADNPDAILYLTSICEGTIEVKYRTKLCEQIKTVVSKYSGMGKKVYYLNFEDFYDFTDEENFILLGPGNTHPNHIGHYKIATAYAMTVINDVLEINKQKPLDGGDNVVDPETITISKNELSLKTNQQKTLTYEIGPKKHEVSNIIWSSSDPFVVTVNHHGLVTAVSSGEATITARIPGTEIKAECKVKVSADKFSLKTAEKTLLSDDFSSPANWSGNIEQIYDGSVLIPFIPMDLNLVSSAEYNASKNSATMQFTNRMTMLTGKSSKSRWFKVYWGDYVIETNDNWAKTSLYYEDTLLGSHYGSQRGDYEETFTLNFENGKVCLYINNELCIRTDAPADPKGNIKLELHNPFPSYTSIFYFDNLIVKG